MAITEFTYKVPRMETIDNTAKLFGLSSYMVRKLARSRQGKAFTVRIGSRYLLNVERFAAFLNCETNTEQDQTEAGTRTAQGIQAVPVKL